MIHILYLQISVWNCDWPLNSIMHFFFLTQNSILDISIFNEDGFRVIYTEYNVQWLYIFGTLETVARVQKDFSLSATYGDDLVASFG